MADDAPGEPLHHYDGGDTEPELVAAATTLLADDQKNAVRKIKEVYWRLGNIIEIAIERGYTKRLGTKAWIVVNLKCSHTHGYACLNAWKERRTFNDAYKWYKLGNTDWEPGKATGPLFAIELHKAYQNRDKTDAEKLGSATRKKASGQTIKKAVRAAGNWKSRYERLREEHRKLARDADREPVVLNQIELEIQREESGEDLPAQATAEPVNPGLPSAPGMVVQFRGKPPRNPALDPDPPNLDAPEPGSSSATTPTAAKAKAVKRIQTNKPPPPGTSMEYDPAAETLGDVATRSVPTQETPP